VGEVATVSTGQVYTNGKCCVLQPVDGSEYDRCYHEVLVPAIEGAGLKPYRVDKDAIPTILTETMHQEIQNASICVADITTRNSTVMYWLGLAITYKKEVVILCGPSSKRFPFDVQHGALILYKPSAPDDFKDLGSSLTVRLAALIPTREVAAGSRSGQGWSHAETSLNPNESTALALLLTSTQMQKEYVTATFLRNQMRKAGYSAVGSRTAIYRLTKLGFVKSRWVRGDEADSVAMIGLTVSGRKWLVDNQAEFERRTASHI
jgi:hypothetical protein